MKPAKIIWYAKRRSENDCRAELRAGKKGRGHVIQVVDWWPLSPLSLEKAYDIFYEVAQREGYEVVATDRDVPE